VENGLAAVFPRVYINIQSRVLRMPTILDLCSGLGGATEAFSQAGWNVIRIESNPELAYVPFTQTLDVLEWEEWVPNLPDRVDVVWASPPCREFSRGFAAPAPTAERAGLPFEPSMELVRACLDIIDYLKPKWWVIENVRGALSSFIDVHPLGKPKQNIGPFFLWGNFPRIIMPYSFEHLKSSVDVWSTNPLRANLKAMIPFEVSFAFLESVTRQQTLERWCSLGD